MADQAVAEQSGDTRRLGEEYEVFENGVRVMVRAIAPPVIIKDFLAARNRHPADTQNPSANCGGS